MFKGRFVAAILSAVIFFLTASPVLAGGGPVEFRTEPNNYIDPHEQYVVYARVYAAGTYPTYCKNCLIHLEFENPDSSDYIAQSSERTDDDGRIYAKVTSKISGIRTLIVKNRTIITSEGAAVTANSYISLNFIGESATSPVPSTYPMPGAPKMVYPVDGQTLDLEGAYMFKVKPVEGASGYLFGLFQNGNMVYENYRDGKYLSSNGEFALWENNPFHAKFHNGEVKVMIRAYVGNQWTDAREITIILRPRGGTASTTSTNSVVSTTVTAPKLPVMPPTIQPSQKVIVITDSSASAVLQKRIDELQNKLEQSQQKQSVLENRLNLIISWIKSFFPFFK